MPNVTTSTHPLLQKTHQDEFYEGMNITQIVEESAKKYKMGPWLRKNIYVELDGTPVTKENWSKIFPNAGQHIAIKFNVPMGGGGGGGKNPLKAILSIVVVAAAIIVAPYIAPGISSALTGLGMGAEIAGGIGLGLAQMGIITAGSLLVNALVPNKPLSAKGLSYGDTAESKIYTISGMQNQERPYGALPVVLGKMRFAPYFGAKSYTEIRGDDQYLHAALLWGYGPLMISDIKNGDTDFAEYDEVQIRSNQGWETDTELDLYPQGIYENYISSVLKYNNPVIRTSVQDVDDINIDLVFSKGLVHMTDQAKREKRSVSFSVEWKKTDETVYNELLEGAINSASYTSSSISVFNAMVVCAYLDRKNMQVKFATKFHERASSDYWFGTISLNPWKKDTIAVYKFSASPNVSENAVGKTYVVDGYSGFSPSVSIDRWMTAKGSRGTNHARMTLNIGQGTYLGDRFKRFTITGATSQPLLRTVQLPISEKGQYDVKITRLTKEPGASNTRDYDECTWAVLRNIKNEDPIQFPVPVAETQLVVKATDQLNGNLKQLNGIVSSVCLDYDSTSDEWVMQETNNPASLLRHVLQSPANASAVPDEQIDLEGIEEFHNFCAEEGFTYNRVIDGQTSVWSLLTEIAAAGRSAISIIDNRWTVIIDKKRTDGPVQMFTPANSWGFKSNKSFIDDLHGYRCQFNNEEKQYQEDEVYVYAEGYSADNASKFEAMEFAGVTNVTQIQNLARYNLAVRKYRPELFTWNADFESMVCARGDLVTMSHYIIMVGFESGRVKAVSEDGLTVTLDQQVTLTPEKQYGLRVRDVSDSAKFGTRQITSVTENTTTNEITLVSEVGGISVLKGDLFVFGELGKESIDVIITGKIPNADMSATITGIQYSWDEIEKYLEGENPPFDSGITKDVYDVKPYPPLPVILSVSSDESMMIKNDDGTLQSRLSMVVSIPSSKIEVTATQAQMSIDGGDTWYQSPDTDGTKPFIFSDVQDGVDAVLRVRTVSNLGVTSEWVTIDHTIIGRTSPPVDIANINYDNRVITWDYPEPPIDFAGFRVKTSTYEFVTWETAVEIPAGLITDSRYVLPDTFGRTLVMVKAVDVAGNESINFASVLVDAGDPVVENIVVEFIQEPLWEGERSGSQIIGGKLVPLDTSLALMPKSATALMPKSDIALQTLSDQMIYSFKVWVKPEYIGSGLTLTIDAINSYKIEYRQVVQDFSQLALMPLDEIALVDKGFTDSNAYLMFEPSDELMFEPSEELMFIEPVQNELALVDVYTNKWLPWSGRIDKIQDISYYEFKITYEGGKNTGSESLNALKAVIDVPDVVEIITGVDIPVNGARLPVTKDFISIKTINLTLENADTDNATSVKIKDRSVDGPMIVVYDSNGNSVTGRVTATIQGY